jgi:glycosyl transferase family 87
LVFFEAGAHRRRNADLQCMPLFRAITSDLIGSTRILYLPEERSRTLRRDHRVAFLVWLGLLISVLAFYCLGPRRSVTGAYAGGATHWMARLPLYSNDGTGFIYLPQAAVIFVPFASLPIPLGDVLWRCLTVGVFVWGVGRLSGLAERADNSSLFALVTLIAAPMAWSSAQNGQSTLPMAGLMMSAVCYMAEMRWWRAAVCLALALAFKPLALVLILLSGAVYRPMIMRLATLFVVLAAVPFLTQSPDYVWSQYLGFVDMTRLAVDHSNVVFFAQLFGLLRVAGLETPERVQSAIRVIFAVATLLVCLVGSRRVDHARWPIYFYAMAASYLTLFNPRTENNTYSLLGPAVGIFFARAVRVRRSWPVALFLGLIAAGIVGGWEIGRQFTSREQSIWVAPLMGIGFSVYLGIDIVSQLRRRQAVAATSPSVRYSKAA